MSDYDSATPLYDFLPKYWGDDDRGKVPLAWGINPNLIETYPDIISYFYKTAAGNDYFVSDASAAGYFNPNRVQKRYIPLLIRHNRHFFKQTDMSIAPMVLDWDEPTDAVKDAFTHFSPDGFATIVLDFHGNGGKAPRPHVWRGMPVLEMLNTACHVSDPKLISELVHKSIKEDSPDTPRFYYFRIVWVGPKTIVEAVESLRKAHPELDFKVVDLYTFFALFKKTFSSSGN